MAEWHAPLAPPEETSPMAGPLEPHWIMRFDGSKRLNGARAGVVLISPEGKTLEYAAHLDFNRTNNMAECEALLLGLRLAKAMGVRRLLIQGDSQLVITQMDRSYQCLDERMKKYIEEVRKMERYFLGMEARCIPRGENHLTDRLARTASSKEPLPPSAFFEVIRAPSIEEEANDSNETSKTSMIIDNPSSWMTPIIRALKGEVDEEAEGPSAKTLLAKAKMYVLLDGILYKKSAAMLLKCITPDKGAELLQEIHSGVCGHHLAPRATAAKALRQGFYWPTMVQDAITILRRCEACQNMSQAIQNFFWENIICR